MNIFPLLLPIFLAIPTISIKWKDDKHQNLVVSLVGGNPAEEECLNNGLTVAYRYEFKFCRKRSWWLDACSEEIREVRTLQYEPISESYFVSLDRLGDAEPEQQSMSLSKEEALKDLYVTELSTLPRSTYVQSRVRYTCKGDQNRVLDRISNIVSLGLVSLGAYQSDWIDFYFDN